MNLTAQPVELSRGSSIANCANVKTKDLSPELEPTKNPEFDDKDRIDVVNSLNEMINSCFNSSSSTSTASHRDVLSSKSEFPTDLPKVPKAELD